MFLKSYEYISFNIFLNVFIFLFLNFVISHILLWFLFICISHTKGQRQRDEYFVHFIQRYFMTNGLNMTGFFIRIILKREIIVDVRRGQFLFKNSKHV